MYMSFTTNVDFHTCTDGFVGGGAANMANTSMYNWTYITALAVSEKFVNDSNMNDLMCAAHANEARMIYWIADSLPFTDDINS